MPFNHPIFNKVIKKDKKEEADICQGEKGKQVKGLTS
jgi:hypothetical protein